MEKKSTTTCQEQQQTIYLIGPTNIGMSSSTDRDMRVFLLFVGGIFNPYNYEYALDQIIVSSSIVIQVVPCPGGDPVGAPFFHGKGTNSQRWVGCCCAAPILLLA